MKRDTSVRVRPSAIDNKLLKTETETETWEGEGTECLTQDDRTAAELSCALSPLARARSMHARANAD